MRLRLAQIAMSALLIAAQPPIYGQQHGTKDNSEPFSSCPTPTASEEPSSPDISIRDVVFSGFIQLPTPDQDEIAISIKQNTHGYLLDSVVEEALERVRAACQNRGYFKVQVNGDAKVLTESETEVQIALFIDIDENMRYRLGRITFKNNRALTNPAALRSLFPIKDGDIFDREKIAKGLENLRKAYGEYGYINFTPVPNATFDDEKSLAYLEIDVDEGKQFFVSGIDVVGMDEATRQEILRDLAIKPGDVYNSRLWELSLTKLLSLFPGCACRFRLPVQPGKLDAQAGTVAVTLDFSPCSAN